MINFLKQKSFGLILMFSLSMLFAGCTKDNDDNNDDENTKEYRIEGLWIGNYTINGNPGAGNPFISFSIKPDGTVLVESKFENKQHIATGTWVISGSTLTCTYNYIYGQSASGTTTVQTSTATWNKEGKLTSGVWQNTAPNNQSGTFALERIN